MISVLQKRRSCTWFILFLSVTIFWTPPLVWSWGSDKQPPIGTILVDKYHVISRWDQTGLAKIEVNQDSTNPLHYEFAMFAFGAGDCGLHLVSNFIAILPKVFHYTEVVRMEVVVHYRTRGIAFTHSEVAGGAVVGFSGEPGELKVGSLQPQFTRAIEGPYSEGSFAIPVPGLQGLEAVKFAEDIFELIENGVALYELLDAHVRGYPWKYGTWTFPFDVEWLGTEEVEGQFELGVNLGARCALLAEAFSMGEIELLEPIEINLFREWNHEIAVEWWYYIENKPWRSVFPGEAFTGTTHRVGETVTVGLWCDWAKIQDRNDILWPYQQKNLCQASNLHSLRLVYTGHLIHWEYDGSVPPKIIGTYILDYVSVNDDPDWRIKVEPFQSFSFDLHLPDVQDSKLNQRVIFGLRPVSIDLRLVGFRFFPEPHANTTLEIFVRVMNIGEVGEWEQYGESSRNRQFRVSVTVNKTGALPMYRNASIPRPLQTVEVGPFFTDMFNSSESRLLSISATVDPDNLIFEGGTAGELNNFYTEDVFVDPSSALRLSLHSDTTDYYKGDLVVLFGNFTMGASPMTGENLHVIVLSQTSETPIYQASLTTDSAGKYRTVFTLPENTPKGRYTATVTSSRFWTSARISFNVLALKPPDMPILRLTSADAYPFGAAVTLLGKFTNGTRPLPGRIVEITVSDPQGLSVNNLSVATDLDGRFSTKLILNSLATGIFTAQAIEKQSKAIARASFVVYPLAESGKHCREISIETDRSNYVEGDSAMIQVKFTHLLPTCAEPAVIHYHTLKVEVFDSQGKPIRLLHSQNVTETTLLTLRWPVERDGNYRIRASSWLNGKVLEAENSTQVTVQTQRFRFLMDSSLKEKSVLIAIDGNLYRTDQLPLAFYWAAGSTHLIEFDPEQYGGSSTRWLFLQWKGDLMDSDPIQQIASDRSRTVVMIWKKQFYLDVESETGTTSGQGWYDYSSRATFSVSPSWVQTGFFTGKVFAGWTGDSTATDPIADVSMDSPKQVSATWMDVSGISSIVYTLVPYSILELVLLPQVWLSPVLAFALAFWLCLGALLRLIIQRRKWALGTCIAIIVVLLATACVQGLLSRLGTVLVIYAPPYALTSGLGVMIQSRIRRRGNPILKQNQ